MNTATFTKDEFFQQLLKDMAAWVGMLAPPFSPPQIVPVDENGYRLEFRVKRPETVMFGKVVRAVSGIYAAMHLAEAGYVTECGTLLRTVSDLCAEVCTIAVALHAERNGNSMHRDVQSFVDDYFRPLAKSTDEFATQAKTRYISREALMRAKVALSPVPNFDSDTSLKAERFLNKIYDGFVHGYFESAMELWDPTLEIFEVEGRSDRHKKAEYIEATILKLHGVITAIELTASMTGCDEVFRSARSARQRMDQLGVSGDPPMQRE